jgi:hypothetical protein
MGRELRKRPHVHLDWTEVVLTKKPGDPRDRGLHQGIHRRPGKESDMKEKKIGGKRKEWVAVINDEDSQRNILCGLLRGGGRRPLHLPFPIASPAPAFRYRISLDKQNRTCYAFTDRPVESNVLSNIVKEFAEI